MDIVLAVFLLFGGFVLGSATTEQHDDVQPSRMTLPSAQDVSDSACATQGMRACRSGQSGRYRDLTVPYVGQGNPAAPKAASGEDRDRAGHPAALPLSLEISATDE